MRALFLTMVLVILCACASKKESRYEKVADKSTENIYQSKYQEKYYALRDSLAKIAAPKEQSQSKGLLDSYLFTSLAESRAWLDSTGVLNHTLNNKDSIPTKYIIERLEIIRVDTLYIHKTDTMYVEVDKEIVITKEPSIKKRIEDAVVAIVIFVVLFFGIKLFVRGK